MEERSIKVEVRAAMDDPNCIEGYAAVFDSMSEDLGGFRETIMPGAFKRALAESPDILCVVDHDSQRLLGRTSSGTCQIMEDDRGLRFRCNMPNTNLGRDMMALIARGDYSQCSFKFGMDPDDEEAEEWEEKSGVIVRTIRSVALLGDVSPVLTPAYRATSVSVA
jgi:HK97 family phage prohead protease